MRNVVCYRKGYLQYSPLLIVVVISKLGEDVGQAGRGVACLVKRAKNLQIHLERAKKGILNG